MSNSIIPSGLEIPDTKPIGNLQAHMERLCKHFGWDTATDDQTFLLFIEEIGELAKALRKHNRLFEEAAKTHDADATHTHLEEEFSDVFSYLLDLANRYDINLGEAYRAKMTANFSRSWK